VKPFCVEPVHPAERGELAITKAWAQPEPTML
jgi:hypothetical protein